MTEPLAFIPTPAIFPLSFPDENCRGGRSCRRSSKAGRQIRSRRWRFAICVARTPCSNFSMRTVKWRRRWPSKSGIRTLLKSSWGLFSSESIRDYPIVVTVRVCLCAITVCLFLPLVQCDNQFVYIRGVPYLGTVRTDLQASHWCLRLTFNPRPIQYYSTSLQTLRVSFRRVHEEKTRKSCGKRVFSDAFSDWVSRFVEAIA